MNNSTLHLIALYEVAVGLSEKFGYKNFHKLYCKTLSIRDYKLILRYQKQRTLARKQLADMIKMDFGKELKKEKTGENDNGN